MEDEGRFALQRGPVVYCVEDKDQSGLNVRHIVSTRSTGFTSRFEPKLLNGVQIIEFTAHTVQIQSNGSVKTDRLKSIIKAIPYCVWANRGPGDMIVWIPYKKKFALTEP